jgi:hypothetical protein
MTNGEATQYMTFVAEGYTFTKYAENGDVVQTGTFKLDSSKKWPEEGDSWSIAELTLTGASVIYGVPRWGGAEISTYYVITLSDTQLVLASAAGVEWGTWDGCTGWSFKVKE